MGLHWWKERCGNGEVSLFNDLPVIFLPAHMGQRCLRLVAILGIIKRRLMIRERSVFTGSIRNVHAHHCWAGWLWIINAWNLSCHIPAYTCAQHSAILRVLTSSISLNGYWTRLRLWQDVISDILPFLIIPARQYLRFLLFGSAAWHC